MSKYITCTFSAGMLPSEYAVTIKSEGRELSLFAPKTNVVVTDADSGRGLLEVQVVDGDHNAVQVAREIDRYADLLAPGGCLVFHDYGFGLHNGQPEAHPGVRQAVDAELMNSDTFRPIALAHMTMAFEKAS